MKLSSADAEKTVRAALRTRRTISLTTWRFSDYGEMLLGSMTDILLGEFGRIDLREIVYTSAKELIINATKANVKRCYFRQHGLDINNPGDYAEGMKHFKEELTEKKMNHYRALFKQHGLPVTATYYYTPDVLNIKVKNSFPLLPEEEQRIRDKFRQATSFSSLLDFFIEHGDDTEGAGMGLTMVGILLDESGIDKHAFSLYSSEKYQETIAKLEIPLSGSYISKRKIFDIECERSGKTPDQLRPDFHYSYRDFRNSPYAGLSASKL